MFWAIFDLNYPARTVTDANHTIKLNVRRQNDLLSFTLITRSMPSLFAFGGAVRGMRVREQSKRDRDGEMERKRARECEKRYEERKIVYVLSHILRKQLS